MTKPLRCQNCAAFNVYRTEGDVVHASLHLCFVGEVKMWLCDTCIAQANRSTDPRAIKPRVV